jgi:hypothetical protein
MALISKFPLRTLAGGRRTRLSTGVITAQSSIGIGTDDFDSVSSPGPPYVNQNSWLSRENMPAYVRYTGRDSTNANMYENWFIPVTPESGVTTTQVGAQVGVNQALAKINPNTPVVSLPNFLFELKEFPSMLRGLGTVLRDGRRRDDARPELEGYQASDIPGAYLAWQFGWAPLLSDVNKLINLAEHISNDAKRFERIAQTRSTGGVLQNVTSHTTLTPTVVVAGLQIQGLRTTKTKVWFSAHWSLTSTVPQFDADGAFSQYKRALGFNQPATAIWNAIPWSFLVDYFADVGSFLEASEGMMGYSPTTMCIMMHTESSTTDIHASRMPAGGQLSEVSQLKGYEKRREKFLSPTAKLTLNSHPLTSRLGVLGALATAGALKTLSPTTRRRISVPGMGL